MAKLKYQVYRFIDHLMKGEPVTAPDLAEEMGCDRKTAQRHLSELWSLDLLYICAWDREHHHPIPVYLWGPKKSDAPRPRPMTPAEAKARRRQRMKETSA